MEAGRGGFWGGGGAGMGVWGGGGGVGVLIEPEGVCRVYGVHGPGVFRVYRGYRVYRVNRVDRVHRVWGRFTHLSASAAVNLRGDGDLRVCGVGGFSGSEFFGIRPSGLHVLGVRGV